MKNKTSGSLFKEIRNKNGFTMLEVANRCGLSEGVVWHFENNMAVRWETAHRILTAGINVLDGGKEYQQFHQLWLEARQKRAKEKPEDHSRKKLSKHATEETRKFRNLVRNLDPGQARKVFHAAQRAARQFDQ